MLGFGASGFRDQGIHFWSQYGLPSGLILDVALRHIEASGYRVYIEVRLSSQVVLGNFGCIEVSP